MKPTLNLASRTYLNRRAVYAFYGFISAVLVILLVMNLTFFFRSHAQSSQLKERMAELTSELASLRGTDADFSPAVQTRLREKISFANELIRKDSFHWIALLDRLEEVLPDGVRIREIQPDHKEASLKLSGLARSLKDLRHFLDRLMLSNGFSDVYLLQQARSENEDTLGRKESVISFSIVVKGAF